MNLWWAITHTSSSDIYIRCPSIDALARGMKQIAMAHCSTSIPGSVMGVTGGAEKAVSYLL